MTPGRANPYWQRRNGPGYRPASEARDLEIAARRSAGEKLSVLASEFGISMERVRQITADRTARAAPRVP